MIWWMETNQNASVIRRWLWNIRMARLEDVPHQPVPFFHKTIDNDIHSFARFAHVHRFTMTVLLTVYA